jgi:DENN (AEX-3) domain
MDAITFETPALVPRMVPYQDHPKWFLHRLFEEHRKLCAEFASLPHQERKALTLTVENVEVGQPQLPLIQQVDTCKYLIPTSMLASTTSVVEAVTTSPILPLLRVLGVSSTLRLLSALLSENRVLMISSSPTRLAQCARSALSILAQGLLNWQHLFIPVLPPHLFQYLGAPVPYLIGMLTSLVPRLEQAYNEGLGEMVIINLDNQQMETRGMAPADVPRKVPDLFQKALFEQGMPASTMSSSEMLAQDLTDLLKVDKRVLYGESTLTNVSETAAKATKAVKTGISKLAKRGKTFFNNRMGSNVSDTAGSGTDDEGGAEGDGTVDESAVIPQNTLIPDFIYIQGSQNEPAEEEARIAFTSFFLSMFGNMRWYLSANPGQLPALDRNRFLQQKRSMGEGENTPVWPLLQNFVHTQMLEQFAKSRVEEVRLRLPVTADSPLFTQCSNYHRMHNIDFSVVNVRRVARQVAQNNPSRMIVQTAARRTAMMLTSNRTFEGDYNKAVAQLVEQCRECTSHLFDVSFYCLVVTGKLDVL